MSMQLTFKDAEMKVVLKAIEELFAISDTDAEAMTEDERDALVSARLKLKAGLNRPSRRSRA